MGQLGTQRIWAHIWLWPLASKSLVTCEPHFLHPLCEGPSGFLGFVKIRLTKICKTMLRALPLRASDEW